MGLADAKCSAILKLAYIGKSRHRGKAIKLNGNTQFERGCASYTETTVKEGLRWRYTDQFVSVLLQFTPVVTTGGAASREPGNPRK